MGNSPEKPHAVAISGAGCFIAMMVYLIAISVLFMFLD